MKKTSRLRWRGEAEDERGREARPGKSISGVRDVELGEFRKSCAISAAYLPVNCESEADTDDK